MNVAARGWRLPILITVDGHPAYHASRVYGMLFVLRLSDCKYIDCPVDGRKRAALEAVRRDLGVLL